MRRCGVARRKARPGCAAHSRVSTQANRNYGPPDGITTGEFDSLTRPVLVAASYCIDRPTPPLQRNRPRDARRYTIILVRERQLVSFFVGHQEPQTACRRTLQRPLANHVPAHNRSGPEPPDLTHFAAVFVADNPTETPDCVQLFTNLSSCVLRGCCAAGCKSLGRLRVLGHPEVEPRLAARRPGRGPRPAPRKTAHDRREPVPLIPSPRGRGLG